MTTRRMQCRDAIERLWAYLDSDLDDVDRDAVEDHLAFCLRCCGELAFAREVRSVLAASRSVQMPSDVQERLERFTADLEIDDLNEESAKP